MAISLGDAILFLRGNNDELNKDLDQAESETQSWAGRLVSSLQGGLGGIGNIIGGAVLGGIAAVSAGIIGLGTAAFAAGQEMDGAFDSIAIATGATGEDLLLLQDSFKDVFATVPASAGAAADAIGQLNARTGLTGPALEDAAANILRLSNLTGGEAKTNAELFSRVMGDWSISGDEAAGALDKIFVASQQTGAGVESLMQNVVAFGSPLRLMGFSLDESIALFAKWEAEGVNAELVMGSLRIAAGKFASEGKPLRDSLLATFDSIKNNTDASKALAEGMEVFGARAGPDMVAAIREGRFSIDDLAGALANADGALAGTEASTMDFGEKLQLLKQNATIALEPLGTLLMEGLGAAIEAITPALQTWVPLIGNIAAEFVRFFAGLSDGSDLFSILYDAAEALFGEGAGEQYAGFFDTLITGIDSIRAFIIANWPIVQQTIATVFNSIMTVAGAVVGWVAANWPTIQATITTVFSAIANIVQTVIIPLINTVLIPAFNSAVAWVQANWPTIQAIITTVINTISSVITTVLTAIQEFWAANGETIMANVSAAFNAIGSIIQTVIGTIQSVITTVLTAIQTFWAAHGQTILTVAQNVWNLIQTAITTVTGIISNIIQAFAALIQGNWDAFGNYLKTAWDSFWALIVTALNTTVANITTIVSDLIGTITGFFTNTDWGALGQAIIDGLVGAITNGVSAITNAATNAAQAAWNAVTNFLGIGSPSKLMMKVGKYFDQGLAIGIERSADIVDREAKKLAEQTYSRFASDIIEPTITAAFNGARQPAPTLSTARPTLSTGTGSAGPAAGDRRRRFDDARSITFQLIQYVSEDVAKDSKRSFEWMQAQYGQ